MDHAAPGSVTQWGHRKGALGHCGSSCVGTFPKWEPRAMFVETPMGKVPSGGGAPQECGGGAQSRSLSGDAYPLQTE